MNIPCSTKEHRHLQRTNAAVEILNSTVDSFSDSAGIPLKISQTFLGAYGFFNNNLKRNERILNACQSLSAATHAILLSYLTLSTDSDSTQDTLSQVALLSQLVYKGLVLTSWAMSEAKKQDVNNNPRPEL